MAKASSKKTSSAAQDAIDARRYRFLRDEHARFWTSRIGGPDTMDISFDAEGHDVDAAVDAALKASS